jgi:hypothetical protein
MEPDLQTDPRLEPVLKQLERLEPLFHSAAPGATTKMFDAIVAPDFWEVGASGRRYNREFSLQLLAKRSHEPSKEEWKCTGYHVQEIAPGSYLLTYTLEQPGRVTRRCTIWRKEAGRWLAVYHQGTVVL